MFCVKEYQKNGKYIGHSFYEDNLEAIELCKKINELNVVNAVVTEIDYDEDGFIFEIYVYNKIKELL